MARRSSYSKHRTSKTKFSALYIGCRSCNELPSVDDVADGVRDLVRCGSSSSSSSVLARLALTVSDKGLKVVRRAEPPVLSETGARQQRRRRSEHSAEKVRHAPSDVLLVGQGVDSDVRAAAGVVLHGFDRGTGSWLHVHVYWFDDGGPDTAARFVRQLSELIDTSQHRDAVARLETKMIASGQLRPRSQRQPVDSAAVVQPRTKSNARAADKKSSRYVRHRLSAAAAAVYRQPEVEIRRHSSWKATSAADDCKWPEHQSRISAMSCGDLTGAEYIMWSDVQPTNDNRHYAADDAAEYGGELRRPASLAVPTPVASLASELRARLATGAPILLPPKDYDTVSRSRGNLNGIDERRCANANIVGGSWRHSDTDGDGTPQTYL